MGKSAQAPQAVDYEKLVPLQTAANKDIFNYSLGASRVNSQTPFGSTSWSTTAIPDQQAYEAALKEWQGKQGAGGSREWVPGKDASWTLVGDNQVETPGSSGYWKETAGSPMPQLSDFTRQQWTQTQSLSPQQQQLYDADVKSKLGLSGLTDALLGNVSNATSQALPSADTYNQQLADAIYRQQTRYLDEQVGGERRALEARLADQGFVPGTPGYTEEMNRYQRTNDLTYGDARDRAIAGGYQQGQTAFENALRLRALPLSELNAVRTGAQPTIPGMGSGQNSVPGLQSVDLLGAANNQYNQQLDAYNAQVGSQNAAMGGLGSIAAALASNPAFLTMLSDCRFKRDINRVGTTPAGVPVYEWTYLWGGPRYRGVMAQDVPHAAIDLGGYFAVDYSKVR